MGTSYIDPTKFALLLLLKVIGELLFAAIGVETVVDLTITAAPSVIPKEVSWEDETNVGEYMMVFSNSICSFSKGIPVYVIKQ